MKRLVALLLALTMFAAWMPAFAEEDGTIRYADRGDQVIKLQERLIQLGFLTGEADGQYGKKTQAAVLSFHKLLLARAGGDPSQATGRSISAEDLEVLYADPFSFYVSDLKLDDQGDEVERLQSALIRLNYLDDKATGNFGENTLEAVKYFQKLNNLPVTGVADKATQDLAATATTAAERPAYKEVQKGRQGQDGSRDPGKAGRAGPDGGAGRRHLRQRHGRRHQPLRGLLGGAGRFLHRGGCEHRHRRVPGEAGRRYPGISGGAQVGRQGYQRGEASAAQTQRAGLHRPP